MVNKTYTCKHCGATNHSSLACFKAPRKPMKTTPKPRKTIKAVSKPKKAESRSKLVKKLDAVFSQYVRLDKSDDEGYVRCVTSGERLYWKEAQNGHFFSRKYLPTRWHDDNCFPQSMRDNVFLHGNYIEYTKFMLDSYGREFVDELEKLAKSGKKITTPEIREKIAYYKTEVERLKSIKGL